MELVGLEPATSWVGCGRARTPALCDLQDILCGYGATLTGRIAVDIGRFSLLQALLAMSA
jgi:hypothetical protein